MTINARESESREKKSAARRPPAAGIGRKPGVPNVLTRDTKELIGELVERTAEQAEGWLKRVAERNPYRACVVWVKMAQLIVPRPTAPNFVAHAHLHAAMPAGARSSMSAAEAFAYACGRSELGTDEAHIIEGVLSDRQPVSVNSGAT
jgi:hypothetical protein